MDVNTILPAAACALLLGALIVLIVVLVRARRRPPHTVVMKDGIDVATSRKGTDSGRLFQGTYDQEGTWVISGAPSGTVRLTLVNTLTGEQYPLQFRQSVGIGRSEDLKELETFLTITGDSRVSRLHCRIFTMEGRIWIEDAGSSNHTLVNESQITQSVELHDGDLIRIGNTFLRVVM